jgi:hypothetical protein
MWQPISLPAFRMTLQKGKSSATRYSKRLQAFNLRPPAPDPVSTMNACLLTLGAQGDAQDSSKRSMWDTTDYGALEKLKTGMIVLCEPDPKVQCLNGGGFLQPTPLAAADARSPSPPRATTHRMGTRALISPAHRISRRAWRGISTLNGREASMLNPNPIDSQLLCAGGACCHFDERPPHRLATAQQRRDWPVGACGPMQMAGQ